MATFEGYQVEMWSFLGAFKVAIVRVPKLGADLFWIGCFQQWTFCFGLEAGDT